MISFELMTKIQFENFMKHSLRSYISETATALRMSEENASALAQDQIAATLKEGRNTPNNFFYAIVNKETGVQLGYIWLTLRELVGY